MNGQHWVHKTQHGDKQHKNKTQLFFFFFSLFCFLYSLCCLCLWLSIHDCCRFSLLFFVFILFFFVLCLVYSMLSLMIVADFVFCVLFLFCLSPCHWVHKTPHGNKQNKNKTQKTKSATIMNGQPEPFATLGIQDTTRRQTK
jgi:predicted membrane protein